MRTRLPFATGLMLLSALLARAQEKTPDLRAAKALKILYAGHLESPRAKAFPDFLKRWFAHVDSVGLDGLDSKKAEPYDVVVADWKRLYGDGKYLNTAFPRWQLDKSFSKPIILVSAVAGVIQHHSKLNWL